jgi:hypothetical protein
MLIAQALRASRAATARRGALYTTAATSRTTTSVVLDLHRGQLFAPRSVVSS